MPRLFSYVVDHDLGFAPCPSDGYCTLARCKFGVLAKNITDLAEVGDWVVGTGGADLRKSAGHGKIIYAMRVNEKMPFLAYCRDERFKDRPDADLRRDAGHGESALVSRHFFYFGRNAIDLAEVPTEGLSHPFEKKGPGFRSDFGEDFVAAFAAWLDSEFEPGVHGRPCKELCPISTSEQAETVRRRQPRNSLCLPLRKRVARRCSEG